MPPAKFNEAQKEEIRRRRMEGAQVQDLAREYGACTTTIWNATKDLGMLKRGGNFGIRGRTLEILQKLVRDGYYLNEFTSNSDLKTLRRLFPVRRVAARQRTIYFLDGREKTAFKVFVGLLKRRSVSHRELGDMAGMFGIKINSIKEKMIV